MLCVFFKVKLVLVADEHQLESNELFVREQEVVGLIEKGLRNKEIANQLHISISTVKSHLTNIFRKLDVSNRVSMLNKVRALNILF